MITVLIVDDHPIVRDGLISMFGSDPRFEVIGEASDGAQAVVAARRTRPDVVLMDLRMPGAGGVEAIRGIMKSGSPPNVLVLTTYDTDSDVLSAIDAGAVGYLLKDAPKEELYRAVIAAAEGRTVLAPKVAALLLGRMRGAGRTALSPRETEVLELIAAGRTNREAAKQLFVSEATVKTHLLHAYAKLGVNDRAAAVAAAYSRGYLKPDSG